MDRITIFNKAVESVGLHTRHSTEGKELELVNGFIDYYCQNFLRTNRMRNLAVFVEPYIASGFPDIVFAAYNPSIMDNWSAERAGLNVADLKVLSYLLSVAPCNGEQIIASLKMPEVQVFTSVEKLFDAKLIERTNKKWCTRKMSNIYSIQKLISVEAKIGDVRKVAAQSFRNTWFASQSYALTSAAAPQESTITCFKKQGIGLYCKGKNYEKVVEAQRLPLPSSYISLQFNEWIGNFMMKQ
ncbi:MAG TPA: hypothetical protein PLN48_11300 [Lachnospiraceae bacterium]|nr:hypothetical protein [Lachnospiraceae bacterium]